MSDLKNLRLAWLRTFLAIADRKNQAAAAADLGVNQATVSRHIENLELALGCKLVQMGPVKVLPAGHTFRPVAEQVIRALEDAKTSLAPPPPRYGPPSPTKFIRVPDKRGD